MAQFEKKPRETEKRGGSGGGCRTFLRRADERSKSLNLKQRGRTFSVDRRVELRRLVLRDLQDEKNARSIEELREPCGSAPWMRRRQQENAEW